jgi:hypothetical protein
MEILVPVYASSVMLYVSMVMGLRGFEFNACSEYDNACNARVESRDKFDDRLDEMNECFRRKKHSHAKVTSF